MSNTNQQPTDSGDQNKNQATDTQRPEDNNWKAMRDKLKAEAEEKIKMQKRIEELEAIEQERKQKELEAQGEYEKALQLEKENMAKEKAKFEGERLNAKIEAELIKSGADPKMAELLVDKAKNTIEIGEDGSIKNFDSVLTSLKEEFKPAFEQPNQVKKSGKTVTSTNNQKVDLTPSNISKMSYAEYLEHVKNG